MGVANEPARWADDCLARIEHHAAMGYALAARPAAGELAQHTEPLLEALGRFDRLGLSTGRIPLAGSARWLAQQLIGALTRGGHHAAEACAAVIDWSALARSLVAEASSWQDGDLGALLAFAQSATFGAESGPLDLQKLREQWVAVPDLGARDMKQALRAGVESLAATVASLTAGSAAERTAGLQWLQIELERLQALAVGGGEPALACTLACAALNVSTPAGAGDDAGTGWLLPALDLPELLSAALESADPDVVEALIACLADPSWCSARSEDDIEALRAAWKLGSADADEQEAALTPDPSPASAKGESPAGEMAPLQKVDPEHLKMLIGEFTACLPGLRSSIEEAAQSPAAVTQCADMVARIGHAADAIGLAALARMLQWVSGRVAAAAGTALDGGFSAWLGDFPQRLRAYLDAPADRSAAGALIDALNEGAAFIGRFEANLAGLEDALARVQLVAGERGRRPTHAEVADVSLEIPADIGPELLEGMLAELPVQTADFSAAMQRVVSGQGSAHDLHVAKRAAHTLKGAANTVGVRGIANLTHHAEDILIALTQAGAMPARALSDALVRVADCLEAMSETVAGVGSPPDDAQQVLQSTLDWANRIDQGEVPSEEVAPTPSAPQADAGAEPDAPAEPTARATPASDPEPVLRVSAKLIDELLRLVGETMISNTQIKEQLRQTVEHTRAVARHNTSLQQLAAELEHLVDVRGVTGETAAAQAQGRAGGLDALEFDRYNELHTVSRRLIEAAVDSRELSRASEHRLGVLAELLDGQGRLAVENQNVVMRTRIVPVATIVSRLQRSVRQTARMLDKRVELIIEGESTAIDGNVLSALVDPLMHLLRNAVDHGIEDAGLRAQRGKPSAGRIGLTFARDGSSIIVRCADDGAGLDFSAIRARAEERGLLAPGQATSDEEVARLILLPGFSTRKDATQVSGRGIGLDAVYSKVLALKGQLRLDSSAGQGLRVELRLPASLMTSHGLLVRVGEQVMAVSSSGIQDILYVSRRQVREVAGGRVYDDGSGNVYDIQRFEVLLGRAVEAQEARDWFPALLVQTETGARRALHVHDVLQSQEIVVKRLSRYVRRPHGVVGVTILGDGAIAPVIDTPTLLRECAATRGQAPVATRSERRASSAVNARRSALVVDDSLSARRAAAQLMRDAGFDVRTAIDGMEAATLLERHVPDIVLVDMEMPRMNGLELTTHMRSRPGMKHVPVVMITSRSTEKHRRLAEQAGVSVYLTKPFIDEQLLEHVERLTETAHA